jgi:hypothetical protein
MSSGKVIYHTCFFCNTAMAIRLKEGSPIDDPEEHVTIADSGPCCNPKHTTLSRLSYIFFWCMSVHHNFWTGQSSSLNTVSWCSLHVHVYGKLYELTQTFQTQAWDVWKWQISRPSSIQCLYTVWDTNGKGEEKNDCSSWALNPSHTANKPATLLAHSTPFY